MKNYELLRMDNALGQLIGSDEKMSAKCAYWLSKVARTISVEAESMRKGLKAYGEYEQKALDLARAKDLPGITALRNEYAETISDGELMLNEEYIGNLPTIKIGDLVRPDGVSIGISPSTMAALVPIMEE